jgi:hypothetical protein
VTRCTQSQAPLWDGDPFVCQMLHLDCSLVSNLPARTLACILGFRQMVLVYEVLLISRCLPGLSLCTVVGLNNLEDKSSICKAESSVTCPTCQYALRMLGCLSLKCGRDWKFSYRELVVIMPY